MPGLGNLYEEKQDSCSLSSLSSMGMYSPIVPVNPSSISSDSSSEGNQYVNNVLQNAYYPARANYMPLVVPNEPAIQDLLRQVTGQNDLEQVESLTIRIVSHRVSLQRIPVFMPSLQSLNLDGSSVGSLRDLGCSFTNLKYLNVTNCSLLNLDGLDNIKSLEVFIADNNQISNIFPCSALTQLKRLSLKDNRITDVATLSFLGMCPLLCEVNLSGNVVTGRAAYWDSVKKYVKNLKILDDSSCTDSDDIDAGNEHSTNENVSSLTDDGPYEPLNSNNNKELDNPEKNSSKLTSHDQPGCSRSNFDLNIPASKQSSTSGQFIHGSVISKARKKRSQSDQNPKNSNSNTSSSSSSNRSFRDADLVFPAQMPQTPVDLELGVIGSNTKSSLATMGGNVRLFAKKWREQCSKRRHELDDL